MSETATLMKRAVNISIKSTGYNHGSPNGDRTRVSGVRVPRQFFEFNWKIAKL
jgi:hypothetical protein